MKWGVRHDTKTYGMSKHQVKKAIKKGSHENFKKVYNDYQREFKQHKRYNELGKESTRIGKELLKSEENDYKKDPDNGTMSKRTISLYKKHNDIDDQMRKIEIDIGKKYVDKFNDARLRDIKYSGSVEAGRKMLQEYGKSYTMRGDGYINNGRLLGGVAADNDYLRPYNL